MLEMKPPGKQSDYIALSISTPSVNLADVAIIRYDCQLRRPMRIA